MTFLQKYQLLITFCDKAFKDSLNSFDKEDNYYNVASTYYQVFDFLNEIRYIKNTGLTHNNIENLRSLNHKLRFILEEFEKNYYSQWIELGEYQTILKMAAHYDRKLECYYRKFNFKIISHNDPFTEDEKQYCLEFNQDVFPEFNYTKFEDIELKYIQNALNNLLSN